MARHSRSLRRIATFALCLVGLWAIPAVLVALPWRQNDRSPIPHATLDTLQPGDTQASLRQRLGPPTTVWPDGTWEYRMPDRWPVVLVTFDAEGRLSTWQLDR